MLGAKDVIAGGQPQSKRMAKQNYGTQGAKMKETVVTKNLNHLAREITEIEGGKVPVNIAQTKEILRCLMELIQQNPIGIIKALLK